MGKEIREVSSPEMLKKSGRIRELLTKPRKEMRSSKISLYLTRYAINKLYRSVPRAEGVSFVKVKTGKIRAVLAECKDGSKSGDIIVYIHGGAFMSGNASVSRGYISCLAKHSGCRVYSLDYSLSPEVKYPVAFEECVEAVTSIISDNPDSKISLIGDSAGANLSLATALKLKSQISSVILNSPVIDFSDTMDRSRSNQDSVVVKKGLKSSFEKLYFGRHDPKDPFISPYFGDYEGLPPTFITCDIDEGLYSDGLTVYEKCEETGVPVKMIVMKGAFHAFAVMADSAPETAEIMSEQVAFMKQP